MSLIMAFMWLTEKTEFFGLGTRRGTVWRKSARIPTRMLLSQLIVGFCHSFFNGSHHIEGLFWEMVIFTCQNLLESFDGLLQGQQLPQMTCEDLSNLEWLRQETLYFPSTRHSQLVFLRKFIHTQDGDDVLEGFVVL